jgi:hypothetical protein
MLQFQQDRKTCKKKKIYILYGPKYENGEWKIGTNRELEEISKGEKTVK